MEGPQSQGGASEVTELIGVPEHPATSANTAPTTGRSEGQDGGAHVCTHGSWPCMKTQVRSGPNPAHTDLCLQETAFRRHDRCRLQTAAQKGASEVISQP